MILCLDVGNTQLFGGVFAGEQIQLRFRYNTQNAVSSDQLGIFLKGVLRENQIDAEAIQQIAVCSVVPAFDYSLGSACKKYFSIEPMFLKAGIKTGLQIQYRNPIEVGADRIANAIAAINAYPNRNIIIVDFGTATTFCAVDKNKRYLGGVIIAGMRLSMDALQSNTAKLSPVSIIKPEVTTGRSTMESIQSGLYFGQLGMVDRICQNLIAENFPDERPLIIGTGGFAYLFEHENIFDTIQPDLVLHGLRRMLIANS